MSRTIYAQDIEMNWSGFLSLIKHSFSQDRRDILLEFYSKYDTRFATMPASGKDSYHNAFVGGYIDHVLRVHKLSFQIKDLWKSNNADIDFTDEELAMVALNHDLGKFGLEEHEYYIDQTEEWKKKKGEIYTHNPAMQFMKTSDRSLYLLQHIGIAVTQKEWLAINLHDGLYEEAARSYYISYSDDFRLRSNLAYIVHQADLAATRIEYGLSHQVNPVLAATDKAMKNYDDRKKKEQKLPEIDNTLVIPSPPHIVKENSSSPSKSKYAHLLNKK